MLHQRIRVLRRRAGMTQDELAKAMGFNGKTTVSGWETGKSAPHSTMLPELAAALKCKIEELFIEEAA